MNSRALFVFVFVLLSAAFFACTPSSSFMPYFYTSFNIQFEVGESMSLLSLPHETNLSYSELSLTSSSPILEITGLEILAVESGEAILYVIETSSQSVLSSIEVKVFSSDATDITYSIDHSSSYVEDSYILSLFYLGEPLIEFSYAIDSEIVFVYKMASVLYISSPLGEIFSITVTAFSSFIVISFPIY